MYDDKKSVYSGLLTGTMWDQVMFFLASDKENFTDLKNINWGNYTNSTLENCNGRILTVNSSNGSITGISKINPNPGTNHYGIITTACSETVKKKNLYDIAGNLTERTYEIGYIRDGSNYVFRYLFRGGMFFDPNTRAPLYWRSCNTATDNCTYYGFRVALYMK